jgi:hypothetical protein
LKVPVNLTDSRGHQQTWVWGLVEIIMPTFFSLAFTLIFLGFILIAILGHVLLVSALLRPFFGKRDLTPVLLWHGLRAHPSR